MTLRSLEERFERFRNHGDAAALAEVFDETAPELLKLARHLTRGVAEAEDVLQATFLAAIEGAQSFEGERALMPWLVGILVRQASVARRRASREVDPVRLDSRAVPDPLEALSAREFSDALTLALESLTPNDRAVLVPLLLDGKRAVQIAREIGVRPDAVRMRIHRGLGRLRQLLPAGFALGAAFTLASGRGLAAVRVEVVRAARIHAGLAPVAATAAGAGLLGSAKLWLGAAVVAIAAFASWRVAADVWPSRPEIDVASALADSQPRAARSELAARAAGAERSALDVSPPAIASDPAPVRAAPVMLRGELATLQAGEGAGTAIEIRAIGPTPSSAVVRGAPAGDGRFALDVRALLATESAPPDRVPYELSIAIDAPLHLPRELRVPAPEAAAPELDLGVVLLERAAVVEGSVMPPDGNAARIRVALFPLYGGAPDRQPVDATDAAPDGRFRLRTGAAGACAVLAWGAGLRPATAFVETALDTVRELPALALDAGFAIEGRVFQAGRTAAEGALVRCERHSTSAKDARVHVAGRRFALLERGFELLTADAPSDASGRYRVSGLSGDSYDVYVARLDGVDAVLPPVMSSAAIASQSEVRAPASGVELDVLWAVLELELSIDGAPLGESEARSLNLTLAPSGTPSEAIAIPLSSGRRFLAQVQPATSYVASVHGDLFQERAVELLSPAAGERLAVPVALSRLAPPGALEIRLSSPSRQPVSLAGFAFFPSNAAGAEPLFVRDSLSHDGVFTLEALPSGRYRVVAHAGGTYERAFGFDMPAAFDVEVLAGQRSAIAVDLREGARLRLSARSVDGASLAPLVRMRNERGEHVAARFYVLTGERTLAGGERLVDSGPNDLAPLPPGRYTLSFELKGFRTQTAEIELATGRTAELAVVLARE